jgi:hypothetical protein
MQIAIIGTAVARAVMPEPKTVQQEPPPRETGTVPEQEQQ